MWMCVAIGVVLLRQPACCFPQPLSHTPGCGQAWKWSREQPGAERAAWDGVGKVSYSNFRRTWSLLPAQPTGMQVSSWVMRLGWEVTMILHLWSEEITYLLVGVGDEAPPNLCGVLPSAGCGSQSDIPSPGNGEP